MITDGSSFFQPEEISSQVLEEFINDLYCKTLEF